LTNASEFSEHPSVAVDSQGYAHIIWQDKRNGNSEIYWKHLVDAPLPKPDLASMQPASWPADEIAAGVELVGDHFLALPRVWLEKAGQPDITPSDITFQSPESIMCSIDLSGVEMGAWDVVIENIDAQRDTLSSGFLVAPGAWDDETRLTVAQYNSYTSHSNARCVAVDPGGNIHVVWSDGRDSGNSYYEVYYKRYDGIGWGPDQRLTDVPHHSRYPAIAIDGLGRIHVVWWDNRDGDGEIYYKRFDGSWSADQRLTEAEGESRDPSVATGPDNRVHVVWRDERGCTGGAADIYYKAYDGISWSEDERIAIGPSAGLNRPSVAVDGSGNVHVVYQNFIAGEDQISYMKHDGVGWSSPARLDSTYTVGVPSITADANDNVYVTWYIEEALHVPDVVRFVRFDGSEWGPVETLTSSDDGTARHSTVAVDADGVVHVTYEGLRDGSTRLYYRRYDGAVWEPEIRLTHGEVSSQYPSSAVDGTGALHVVWKDNRGESWEIYYRKRVGGDLAGVIDIVDIEPTRPIIKVVPNPIATLAEVSFNLPSAAGATVAIYDISGRMVWNRNIGTAGPGANSVKWARSNNRGEPVAPGVYFVTFRTDRKRASTKVVVIR
jgi:hypothetical protein